MDKKTFFVHRITEWGKSNRRSFPWREKPLGVYEALIAEVLLRKTSSAQASAVFCLFLEAFPSPELLLATPDPELADWLKPLGLYNQRTRVLKDICQALVIGGTPRTPAAIEKLPHVGPYIASAVSCFCFGIPVPIVDTNVARVLSRFFGVNGPKDPRRNREVQRLASELLPRNDFVDYNYALLDFGALVCKGRGKPLCAGCVLKEKCEFKHVVELELTRK